MPRTKLDTGLQELRMQVMQVGLQVEDSLAKTLKAVETGNYTSLSWIVETNDTITVRTVNMQVSPTEFNGLRRLPSSCLLIFHRLNNFNVRILSNTSCLVVCIIHHVIPSY